MNEALPSPSRTPPIPPRSLLRNSAVRRNSEVRFSAYTEEGWLPLTSKANTPDAPTPNTISPNVPCSNASTLNVFVPTEGECRRKRSSHVDPLSPTLLQDADGGDADATDDDGFSPPLLPHEDLGVENSSYTIKAATGDPPLPEDWREGSKIEMPKTKSRIDSLWSATVGRIRRQSLFGPKDTRALLKESEG